VHHRSLHLGYRSFYNVILRLVELGGDLIESAQSSCFFWLMTDLDPAKSLPFRRRTGSGWTWRASALLPAHLMPRLLIRRIWRTNFDFTPYRRPTVGFDRLFDLLGTGLCGDGLDGHPPFDIARDGGDSYRIAVAVAVAVAGFRPDDIDVVAQQNQLTITGKRAEDKGRGEYLYRGIAARPFERRFQLADFIEVRSASFENGLLTIALQRAVPEAMRPRKIEIGGGSTAQESSGRRRKR